MLVQNKNTINQLSTLVRAAEWCGFTAMSAAAVLSVLELHQVRAQKPLAMLAPAYAVATASNAVNRGEELIRREKEETAHTVVSYGETMRSHPTSGF